MHRMDFEHFQERHPPFCALSQNLAPLLYISTQTQHFLGSVRRFGSLFLVILADMQKVSFCPFRPRPLSNQAGRHIAFIPPL